MRLKPTHLLLSSCCSVLSTSWAAEPELSIQGLDKAQTDNVRAFLTLANLKCDAPDWRLQTAQEKAQQEITNALQALGYYQPKIQGGEIRRKADCWSVSYKVDAGSPVRIAEVDIQVRNDAGDEHLFRKLVAKAPVKTGEVLNHGNYENTKSTLLSLAASLGYFEAEFTDKRLLVDPATHQAWVHISLNTGPRYRFGKVRYQVDALDERLVNRYQAFAEGDYFNHKQVNDLQQALVASNYFEDVSLHQERDAATKTVKLVAELRGRKQHSYGFGVGLTTDKGPRVNASYENRYLNSRGHRFLANAELTGIGGKAITSYAIPLGDPTKEWLTFSGSYDQEQTDDTDRYTFKLGSRITTALPGDWLQALYLDLEHEEFEVAGIKDTATPLVPGASWERIRKQHGKRILGDWLKFEVLGAPVDFSNGSTFLQTKAFGYWAFEPWPKGRVLARAELGATWAEDRDRLAVSHRFFAGGDRSVRGYEYQSLGPKNSNNEVIGGTYLTVGSLEYEHMVAEDWAVAAFFDAGNAYHDELDTLYQGVGLGARWFSPIGPIKVDLAHPLDDSEDGVRLHVSIGPEF